MSKKADGRVKLSDAQILEMRALYELAGWSRQRITRRFDLDDAAVRRYLSYTTRVNLVPSREHLPEGMSSLTLELPRYTYAGADGELWAWALKIKRVFRLERCIELHFEDDRYVPMRMSHSWADYHAPAAGGYLAIFEDNNAAHVLAEHFEATFTRVAEGEA